MFSYVATILVAILLSAPLIAGITPFPASFHAQTVPTNGTNLYVRVGGKGPAVVLLHGFSSYRILHGHRRFLNVGLFLLRHEQHPGHNCAR